VIKKPEPSLRARALQYLARREYSRAELRGKLLQHVQVEEDFEQPQPNGHGKYVISDDETHHARFPLPSPLPQAGEGGKDSLCELHIKYLDVLLDDLTARGWLSDARAATQLMHAKRSRFGTQRITHELRQKGIAEELITGALPALKESELATARNVWQKKFGTPPQDAKEKARQMRFLQSRGFSLDIIFRVLRSEHDIE